MWYEILPGFGLMTICLILPGVVTANVQKFTNGGKEKRVVRAPWAWYLMERDRRLAGTGRYYDSKVLVWLMLRQNRIETYSIDPRREITAVVLIKGLENIQ